MIITNSSTNLHAYSSEYDDHFVNIKKIKTLMHLLNIY